MEKEALSYVRAKEGAVKWVRTSVLHSLVQKIKVHRGPEMVRVILYTFPILNYKYNSDSRCRHA